MPRRTVPDVGSVAARLAVAPVLRRLGAAAISDLAVRATVRSFEHGEVMIAEECGAPQRSLVAVPVSGWCTAVRSRPDGSRALVAVVPAGGIAGVERLAPAGAASGLASWVASGNVVAIRVPAENVGRAVESNEAARDELLRCFAERLAQSEELLADRFLQPGQRLLRALARFDSESVPLTQGELAELIGASRETVNRALRRLATAGVLVLREGRPVMIRPPSSGSGLLGTTPTCQNPTDRPPPGRGVAARAG
jgi:CRP-like cAMP-binding protein